MKNITFITGHYGSGKSEVSINLAIKKGVKYLVDLDIINPYFRSREVDKLMTENNITLIASPLTNALGSDLPYISKEVYTPFYNEEKAIIDLGGNAVGARLVRQFTHLIDKEKIDFFLCVNVFREETNSIDTIKKMINEIESSSGLTVTGLINNSNLLRETIAADVLYGEKLIKQLGIKIVYTTLYEKVDASEFSFAGEVIPLKLYLRKAWM